MNWGRGDSLSLQARALRAVARTSIPLSKYRNVFSLVCMIYAPIIYKQMTCVLFGRRFIFKPTPAWLEYVDTSHLGLDVLCTCLCVLSLLSTFLAQSVRTKHVVSSPALTS